jgi:hypothetical protein
MANASKNHFGKGAQGKRSGTGAMTPESTADGVLGDNQVLSNRDKAKSHTEERGLDSRSVQNEQRQDSAINQQKPSEDGAGTASGQSQPQSTGSGNDSGQASNQGSGGGLAEPDPDAPSQGRD